MEMMGTELARPLADSKACCIDTVGSRSCYGGKVAAAAVAADADADAVEGEVLRAADADAESCSCVETDLAKAGLAKEGIADATEASRSSAPAAQGAAGLSRGSPPSSTGCSPNSAKNLVSRRRERKDDRSCAQEDGVPVAGEVCRGNMC